MEKYSKFQDKGTGVHVFLTLPPSARDKTPLLLLQWYLVGPLLAVLRLPFVLVCAALAAAVALLDVVLSGAAALPAYLLRRLLFPVPLRLLLLTVGVHWVPVDTVMTRKGVPLSGRTASPGAGHLIVANHASYLDVLYLAFRYGPVFALPCTDADAGNRVVPATAWRAFWESMNPTATRPTAQCVPLADVLAAASAPVVVFAEGGTTNGKALAAFCNVLDAVAGLSQDKVHVVGLKYEWASSSQSPAFVVGSPAWHFVRLLAEPGVTLTVRHLDRDDFPAHPSTTDAVSEWVEALRVKMALMTRLKKVSIGLERRQAFVEYWGEQQHKKRK